MKNQLKYMMMMLVAWTMLITWAVTLPSSIVLGLALVCKSLVWMGGTNDLLITLSSISTPALSSIMLLLLNLLCLCMFVLSIIDTERGAITKFLGGILTKTCNFMPRTNSGPSTKAIDKHQM